MCHNYLFGAGRGGEGVGITVKLIVRVLYVPGAAATQGCAGPSRAADSEPHIRKIGNSLQPGGEDEVNSLQQGQISLQI
jgi:hypothetical protein